MRRARTQGYVLAAAVVCVIVAFGVVATVLHSNSTTAPAATSSSSTGTVITTRQSNASSITLPSNGQTSSQCSEPCALWTRVLDGEIYSDAISSDDSVLAVGTGTGQTNGTIVLFNNEGAVLWNHTLDYIVTSVSVSTNGSYIAAGGYQEAGLSGAYVNGTVLLFDKAGNLLWNVTGSDPVDKVQLSANASNLAVWSEYSISYLSIDGSQVWNYTTPTGFFSGMDMAASGNYVVASVGYLGAHPVVYGWSFLAFNGQGKLLWNYTAADGEEPGFVTVSSDGNYTWASSGFSGWNGSLYLFNQQGSPLWRQQIYSPALSIQIASNLDANVWTNWGNLIYDPTGVLLENITVSSSALTNSTTISATTTQGVTCASPSFLTSYRSGPGRAAVLFLDSDGNPVFTYNVAGGIPYAALSPDRLYAAVAGFQNSSVPAERSYLTFLSLPQAGESCK